jgi:hypothetical protein
MITLIMITWQRCHDKVVMITRLRNHVTMKWMQEIMHFKGTLTRKKCVK